MDGSILARRQRLGGVRPSSSRSRDKDRSWLVTPGASYRFFRRLFLGVGISEKVEDVLSAGIIGAALTVDLTLTFPDGVNVVFVRMRMVPPNVRSLR
ncbi:MAG: hypothetical protein LC751_03585 [Actinobacteria bacterium]|nr:hypothetical protein [Actinomycetota bacterium]